MTYINFRPVINTSLGDAHGEGKGGEDEESRESGKHIDWTGERLEANAIFRRSKDDELKPGVASLYRLPPGMPECHDLVIRKMHTETMPVAVR